MMKLKTVFVASAIFFVLSISITTSTLSTSGNEIIEGESQKFDLHGGQAWACGIESLFETPTFAFSSLKDGTFTIDSKPTWISSIWTDTVPGMSGKAPDELGVYEIWVKLWNGSGMDGLESRFLLTLNVISPSFENPPILEIREGQKIEYEPTTNIPSAELSMEPHKDPKNEWIKFENGILTGTAEPPEVSPEEFSVILTAETKEGPIQTAKQEIKIKVYETFEITSVSEVELVAAQALFSLAPTANMDSAFSFSNLPEGAVDHFGTIYWVPTEPGDYTFAINAESTEGPLQTATQMVKIKVYPALSFSSLPEADMVVVTNESSFDFYSMSKYATSVLWDFGDGTTSTEFYPEHSYLKSGKYTVKLTAYNDFGESTTEREINIVTSETNVDEGPSWIPLAAIIGAAVAIILIVRYFTPFR